MIITETRIKLASEDEGNERIRGYAAITIDGTLHVGDIRIVQASSGRILVLMPSRRLTDRCPSCDGKNHLTARYCSSCGDRLEDDRARLKDDGTPKLYADVAYPIHREGRALIEAAVLHAYAAALDERAILEAYVAAARERDAGRIVAA